MLYSLYSYTIYSSAVPVNINIPTDTNQSEHPVKKPGAQPSEPAQEPSATDPNATQTPAPASNPYEKWGRIFKFTTEDDKEVRISPPYVIKHTR